MKIRFNNNRVNVLTKTVKCDQVRLSVHRGFKEAPDSIWEAIMRWGEGKEIPTDQTLLRTYINQHITLTPKPTLLEAKGKVYDLQLLFDELNETYFQSTLDLPITWFRSRARRHITLGQYCPASELIRINRRLDNRRYPRKYVTFIIYHEMLHHVISPTYDKLGRCRYHNPEFRKRERLYHHYAFVQEWESNGGA